jgi:hypothetical protein
MYARGVASITRRKKPLARLIRIYNRYCAQLGAENVWNPQWGLPKPRPLPTNPDQLKDDAGFLESINLRFAHQTPRWSSDPSIRLGIRAMLKLDRCREEERRLRRESLNMLEWFKQEMTAVNVALRRNTGTLGIFDCFTLLKTN